MGGIHSPISKHLFTLNGAVRTSGGSANLAKGELAIVNKGEPTANGAKVVSNFAGLPKSTVYEIRVGKASVPETRSGQNSKPYSTPPFLASDVVDVRVSAPKVKEQRFDDYIIGYDGINDDTAISLAEGTTTVIDLILWGDPIGVYSNQQTEYRVKMHFGKEVGQTDQEVVEQAVARLKNEKLPTNVPITDFVDFKVVNSDNDPLSGIPYTFSTLTIADEGDSNALALVQAQYPTYKVIRTNRVGVMSEYTILHLSSVSLSAYSVSIPSYIKDCANCLSGYSALTAGYVYSVSIEDGGADLSTTVDDLTGAVSGTVTKIGQDGTNAARGLYSIVLTGILTDAQKTTFLTASSVKGTALIRLVGDVVAVCSNSSTTTTAWVNGATCFATVQNYKIQLKDDDCNGSRLTELQAAYPNLVIQAGTPTGNATRTVTLTGSSGTANINVNTVDYLATYNTNLTTTASDWVTANAAAVLADTGLVVTSSGAVITFAGAEQGFAAITATNASGNLAGTVGAIVDEETATTGGCQRVYTTEVTTNIVCEQCDDIFTQGFTSTRPTDFDFISWELVAPAPSSGAKMGIRVTGKPFIMSPGETLRDVMPFYETSTRIKIAGGYIEEPNWSNYPVYDGGLFSVKMLDRAQDRDHLGGHLMQLEDMSRTHFDGTPRHRGNLVAKAFLGEESVLDHRKQYVDYTIVIKDNKFSQGVGGTSDITFAYVIHAEVGRHTAVETLVNKLAAKAGLDAVQAFANA